MTKENSSQVNYLDEKTLKELAHELACQLFAQEEPMGLYEDHDQGLLDSSINLPRQGAYGEDFYPGIFTKAAVTFYAFNRNHPFGNGNKRMSVAAMVVFLFINDQALDVPTSEMRDKALWLAQVEEPIGEVIPHLSEWIQQRCIPMKEYLEKALSLEK